MSLVGRDLISIHDLSRVEILEVLELGKRMHDAEKQGRRNNWGTKLEGMTLASLFYEASTRTRQSFDTAVRELGGRRIGFSGTEGTSVAKGETIRDTVMMYCANHAHAIVMRHPRDGSLQWAADVAHIPVVNGGDGKNEHPTQALLDLLTMYVVRQGKMNQLRVGFGGDLAHGRTVGSLTRALSHFERVEVHWAAHDIFAMPSHLEHILEAKGVRVVRHDTVKDVLQNVDFYYMTRPQMERMNGTPQEEVLRILAQYRITPALLTGISARIMHPLPIDSRLREIEPEVAFLPNALYYLQAEMGIFARKALLHELLVEQGQSDYLPYSGVLPFELASTNNRLQRAVGHHDKPTGIVHSIENGIVIDHLSSSANVDAILQPEARLRPDRKIHLGAYGKFPDAHGGVKTVYKTDLPELTERELRSIALASPGATINVIREGRVIDKFVYVLCGNENCVTRVVEEAVPAKLYAEDGHAHCRYCRKPVEIPSRKVTAEERAAFIASLPTRIEPIVYR